MKLSGAEMVWLFNTVPHELRKKYVHWMNGLYYNRVADTNMYIYGDLTRMPDNSTYVPDITWITDQGFEPDIERDFYYATSDVVPPPYSFVYVPNKPCSSFCGLIALTPIVVQCLELERLKS
jgi:hypothetical protein